MINKIIVISSLILLSGCNPDKDIIIAQSDIKELKTKIEKNEQSIVTKSSDILKETISKTPKIPIIKDNATQIKDLASQNIEEYKSLDDVQAKVTKLESDNIALVKEIEKKDDELRKGINMILLGVYGLGIASIIAGIALLMFDVKKFGGVMTIIGIAILGLVYALSTYALIIGIIAAIIFVSLLVLVGIKIFNDQSVIEELVRSYEHIKNKTTYTDVDKLEVLKMQSDSTIAKVDEVKEKLKIL